MTAAPHNGLVKCRSVIRHIVRSLVYMYSQCNGSLYIQAYSPSPAVIGGRENVLFVLLPRWLSQRPVLLHEIYGGLGRWRNGKCSLSKFKTRSFDS